MQQKGEWVVENAVLLSMLQSHTIREGKIVKAKEGEEKGHWEALPGKEKPFEQWRKMKDNKIDLIIIKVIIIKFIN